MKLEYSRPHEGMGNFGDDLNAWFWDHFFPGLIDDDDSTILLGMGTIFDKWFTASLPSNSVKVVVGSGSGKPGGLPDIDGSWRIYGVRGPLTAAYFGLSCEQILTDPAMLVRDFEGVREQNARRGVGFMPHIWSADHWNWQRTCEQMGLVYVDPRCDSKVTLRKIAGLTRLITEAMHGAIVADALRTPWVAVSIASNFEPSKWCDWGGSLRLPVNFYSVPELYSLSNRNLASVAKSAAKSALARLDIPLRFGGRPPSTRFEIDSAKRRIAHLANTSATQLSDHHEADAAISRTYAAVRLMKEDKERGVLCLSHRSRAASVDAHAAKIPG